MPSKQVITKANLVEWLETDGLTCLDNPLRGYSMAGKDTDCDPPGWIDRAQEALREGWSFHRWSEYQIIGMGPPMFGQVYCVAVFTLMGHLQINDRVMKERLGCRVDMTVVSL